LDISNLPAAFCSRRASFGSQRFLVFQCIGAQVGERTARQRILCVALLVVRRGRTGTSTPEGPDNCPPFSSLRVEAEERVYAEGVFRHEGPARDPRTNTILASYLATVAGFVNSGGFVMIGSFTSHVTGSVGRLGDDLARGDTPAAVSALSLVLAFFTGAVLASLVLERSDDSRPATRYAVALLVEAGVLLGFVFIAGLSRTTHPRILDAQAALLCLAMGMQNSLVTRLSGAVVRTTHLTGVVTDLGIEVARWYRWYRAQVPFPSWRASTAVPDRPVVGRISLLSAVAASFITGAVLGATLTLRASRWAMCFPAGAVLLASGFAVYQGLPRASRPA
jgi:uncharacterized membrane protein YoaK (UPF0700 family)